MKEESKIVFGVGCFYAIITTVFLLISILSIFLYSESQVGQAILSEAIWAAVDIVIIIVLIRLAKKQNQGIASTFRDYTVRKTAGLLILTGGLVTITTYIPAGINVVSLVIKNAYDPSVLPNIITCIIPLLQILVGIYLLIHKSKQGGEYTAKTVFGIAFLFNVITLALSLIRELLTNINSSNSSSAYYWLRLFCIAVILLVLYRLNRKQNQRFAAMFEDGIIRKSTGVLILITGVMSLPSLYSSVTNIFAMINMVGGTNRIQSNIIQIVVRFIIVACQIAFGIYLVKKSKPGGERVVKIVLEFIYLSTFAASTFVLLTKLMEHSVTGDQMTEYYSLLLFAIAAICFIFFRFSKKQQ